MKRVILAGLITATLALAVAGRAGPLNGGLGGYVKLEGHEKRNLGKFTFRGNERACVILIGDHDPRVPLAIYVYSAAGQLVTKDDPGFDYCAAVWYPPEDATYTIEIENRGEQWNKCRLAIK
jgi:hypothetical protein